MTVLIVSPKVHQPVTRIFARAIGTVRQPWLYPIVGVVEVKLKGLIRDHLLHRD